MFKKIFSAVALAAFFILGIYVESRFNISPFISAVSGTGRLVFNDFYSLIAARIPSSVNTAFLIIAMTGFAVLISVRHWVKFKRL